MACLWFYASIYTTETKILEIISPRYGEFTIDIQSVDKNHQFYGRIVKVFINYSIITDKFKHRLFENLIENMKILEKKNKMVLPPKHMFWLTHDNCFHSGCTGDILGVGGKWKLYQKHHIIDKCFERINPETKRSPTREPRARVSLPHEPRVSLRA